MPKIAELIKDKACTLLTDGQVQAVLAWRKGDFYYDPTPYAFTDTKELADLVYDSFCGSNLSKYLITFSKKDVKVAVFLKPCDTYSFNQLLKDNRIKRDLITVIAIPCGGMLDINKIKKHKVKGVQAFSQDTDKLHFKTLYGDISLVVDKVLLNKCLACRGNEHVAYDEKIGEGLLCVPKAAERMEMVRKLEAMTSAERFAFWQAELSKCIRCNACRDVCPACSCEQCVFDDPKSGVASKVNTNSFEEQLFHIVRAYHVAGRCTDCGECARVCPQGVALDLLNRKFIKDINEFYGEYQAGADILDKAPLNDFCLDDVEPTILAKEKK